MDSVAYFKQVVNDWDNLRTGFFTEDVREKAYGAADVKEGHLAADIGAGTGFITEGLLKRGLKVIAVDRSEEMLEQMRVKFNDNNRLDLRQGEAEKLPVEDETVDYAMANMFLHHVEDPCLTINEMARIIKPGGKLVITDLDEHAHEFLKLEHHDRWMGFNRGDIKKWFETAGLKNVTVDCIGGNCCASSECGDTKASISIFLAYGEK